MLASIAPYLDVTLWREWLQTGIAEFDSAAFWAAVLQIFIINALLSGDNAVVIALACRGLPQPQRSWGMVIGAAVAVLLRVAFAGIVAQLMLLPYLKLIGGLTLVYIAASLLLPAEAQRSEIEAAAHLWRVVRIVVVADVVMSLDNVIALAAAANGNVLLLAIGLAVSIPLILAGAALIMALIDRLPVLLWAGSAMLGWVAGEVMATDPAVSRRLIAGFGEQFASRVEFAAAGAGAVLVVALGGLWRCLQSSKPRV